MVSIKSNSLEKATVVTLSTTLNSPPPMSNAVELQRLTIQETLENGEAREPKVKRLEALCAILLRRSRYRSDWSITN